MPLELTSQGCYIIDIRFGGPVLAGPLQLRGRSRNMGGYQLKITIKGSKPPIWRRVVVPDRITFGQLHQVIQAVFGWEDCHLHKFEIRGIAAQFVDTELWEENDLDFYENFDVYSENQRIDEWIVDNPKIIYIYDFGDDWEHQIVMEKRVEYGERYPVVTKYKGDNLPEDCGGIWGYYELLSDLEQESDPENEERRAWAEEQGMGEFALEDTNRYLREQLVFKPARKRAVKPYRRRMTGEDLQKLFSGLLQDAAQRVREYEEPPRGGNRSVLLRDIFAQFQKEELKQIAKLNGFRGYSELKKWELAGRLAEHLLDPIVMKHYFLCMSDEEAAAFEKVAGNPGVPCVLEEGEDCGYLQIGGYCAVSGGDGLVVAQDVAEVYQKLKTEEFHRRRRHVYKVWSYMNAALYLYGVCLPEQITALYNLYEDDVLGEPELHGIFRDIKDCRCDFVYKNGLFMNELLVEDDNYRYVLRDQAGVSPFVPTREMIAEIACVGICDPEQQMEPLTNFFERELGVDSLEAMKAAYIIHHQMRIGCGQDDVLEIMKAYGISLKSVKEAQEFERVIFAVRDRTRMIEHCGHTPAKMRALEEAQDPDRPCPCGSGKKYRQCCGRKTKKDSEI